MRVSLALTLMCIAIAIFSIWFFPYQGYTMAGLVLGTAGIVCAMLLAFITHLLANESRF
jgi:ABC-type transport system involved in multi-copper enzyme maturation permease subunit